MCVGGISRNTIVAAFDDVAVVADKFAVAVAEAVELCWKKLLTEVYHW